MWGAIILGGGSGQRMGAKCNKVLLPIAGKSMIVRSVEAFVPLVEQVVVVSREEDMPVMTFELAQNGLDVPMVSGGATRQESVWRGLQALSGQCDGVLVHDGARCLVTADVIQRCMVSVEKCGTGVAAVPVTDTIKTVSDANIALDTPNRTALRAVQTPQGFKTDLLRQAHEQAQRDGFLGTDDASLVERLGGQVIEIAPDSPNHISPMDVQMDMGGGDSPLSLKADFLLSLCELVVGGRDGLQPRQFSSGHPVMTGQNLHAPVRLCPNGNRFNNAVLPDRFRQFRQLFRRIRLERLVLSVRSLPGVQNM